MQRSVLVKNVITQITSASKSSVRCLVSTAQKPSSFKVQDDKDFLEKVENSKVPVIVDFFAK